MTRSATSVTAAAMMALAAGMATANEIRVVETTTTTVTIRRVTTECHDAATATIPGMPVASQVDGHPSIAERTSPINMATGTPWSKCKGYANCPSEKWTAAIALSGANPWAPPSATASINTKVVVENLTMTTTTTSVHIIIIPERPMCLYDNGVRGQTMLNYSLLDSRFPTPIWQKNIAFDGTEVLGGPVNRDGTTWLPMPGPINLGEFGSFARGMVMQDTFFDVFVAVDLPPLGSVTLDLSFTGKAQLGQNSTGTVGSRYGVVTNTLPSCYANCDQSTVQPVLNVQDFGCFLNRYAAGDTWANCDQSTVQPVLNIQDFACFLNTYAQGCSH